MRVLHVSAYYAPAFVYGGPPRSIHALCRALTWGGVGLQVFTTDANGGGRLSRDITSRDRFDGVDVRYFARTFPPTPIGSGALTAALRREIGDYDVVHIHGLWNRVVWAAAREARNAGVPYVLSPRGMLEAAALAHHGWRKRACWALCDSRVVRGANLLHATSETERATLAALDSAPPVALIPNGVDLPEVRRLPSGAPTIAFIGRIHPIKRLDLLVDAFAAARERRPDLRLTIAGPDEAGLQPALAVRAGRHREAIDWLGAVDEGQRQTLLGRASALVMCSDSESFGMSVLEALAAAVPVIVTRTCPWDEVQRHAAGYWVEQTADAIADAIVSLIADPDAARTMGERGRALARARYRWDAVATAFVEHYGRLQRRAASRRLPIPSELPNRV